MRAIGGFIKAAMRMSEMNLIDSSPIKLLLNLLADGQFHSGEELGELLGVSRAAVWKHLQKMASLGIHINSTKGRGYCIEGGLDLLSADAIKNITSCVDQFNLHLDLLSGVDSTNSYLLRHADLTRRVCVAEFQTQGRGRRGRTWVSPYAQNIYLSMGWGFDGGVAVIEGLSLAVGVAIAGALQKQGVDGIELKWPNDVLYRGKKLAGILIEMVGDPSGYCQVVIGVGVNVAMTELAADIIDQPWTDLRQIMAANNLPPIARNHLAAALITELSGLLMNYQQVGFSYYRQTWEGLSAYANKTVELHNGKQILKGIMLGVTSVGALRLQTENGEEVFHGGELSLRVAP